jgi:hypothetical protein
MTVAERIKMIPTVDTHRIQDSTKIMAFMKCPRMYFFEYVIGWRSDSPNIHLVFGAAWHEAMEHLFLNGMTAVSVEEAYQKFETVYREAFDQTMDPIHEPKTPGNALRALVQYAKQYRHDREEFDVLHTEVAGSVMVGEEPIFFKVDTIVRDKRSGRINSLEHKTTTSFSPMWLHQWRQKFQVGTYTYALRLLYGPDEVDGVIINGVAIRNPAKLKLDGTPYANARDTEFQRVPSRFDNKKMADWFNQALYWLLYIRAEFERLYEERTDAEVLQAFPKNTENCVQYGKPCPYLDYCIAKPNPLQWGDTTPIGMMVDHWDPRAQVESAKEKVEL